MSQLSFLVNGETRTFEVPDEVVTYVRTLRSEREAALEQQPHTVAGLIAALHATIERVEAERDRALAGR
jgi:hypothetical protein